jgi:hypothetical protein
MALGPDRRSIDTKLVFETVDPEKVLAAGVTAPPDTFTI